MKPLLIQIVNAVIQSDKHPDKRESTIESTPIVGTGSQLSPSADAPDHYLKHPSQIHSVFCNRVSRRQNYGVLYLLFLKNRDFNCALVCEAIASRPDWKQYSNSYLSFSP